MKLSWRKVSPGIALEKHITSNDKKACMLEKDWYQAKVGIDRKRYVIKAYRNNNFETQLVIDHNVTKNFPRKSVIVLTHLDSQISLCLFTSGERQNWERGGAMHCVLGNATSELMSSRQCHGRNHPWELCVTETNTSENPQFEK